MDLTDTERLLWEENAALRKLVMETVHDILVALNGPDSNRVHKVREILNRPEVRALKEGE